MPMNSDNRIQDSLPSAIKEIADEVHLEKKDKIVDILSNKSTTVDAFKNSDSGIGNSWDDIETVFQNLVVELDKSRSQ